MYDNQPRTIPVVVLFMMIASILMHRPHCRISSIHHQQQSSDGCKRGGKGLHVHVLALLLVEMRGLQADTSRVPKVVTDQISAISRLIARRSSLMSRRTARIVPASVDTH
ncbi:hypothetical protein DE146DRAFT_628108 [Phaeosphaeria sp. MPI-PUGE-AT-0046c]|nr:hypothetical protein DE146DRAFT_628108 [Phaeosphaeria sp. MPI-PUGE-AT-0046c]